MSGKDYECSDPESYVPPNRSDEFGEIEFDDFKGFQKMIESFNRSCKIFKKNDIESFYYAILYGAYFKLKDEGATCTEDTEELKSVLGTDFFYSVSEKKPNLYLDLNLITFERQCYQINDLLISKNLFLRVFEKRKKFRMY